MDRNSIIDSGVFSHLDSIVGVKPVVYLYPKRMIPLHVETCLYLLIDQGFDHAFLFCVIDIYKWLMMVIIGFTLATRSRT